MYSLQTHPFQSLCTPTVVQKWNTLKVCCPLSFENTNERRHSSCHLFISGAVGCLCLAVPCLGSGLHHCGFRVIINLLGLSSGPLVIWDCWVSIDKGHDKATQWWWRSRREKNRQRPSDEIKPDWKIRPLSSRERWGSWITHFSSLCKHLNSVLAHICFLVVNKSHIKSKKKTVD